MTRAKSNRRQDNLRCFLSVLAAEEINFLSSSLQREILSSSVQFQLISTSCENHVYLLANDLHFTPTHDEPKQESPPKALESPPKP